MFESFTRKRLESMLTEMRRDQREIAKLLISLETTEIK